MSLPCQLTSFLPCHVQEGGVLLTTPERRLSLLLKQQELWQQGEGELCAALGALIQRPSIDLLDESDELLSHRYVGVWVGRWVGRWAA